MQNKQTEVATYLNNIAPLALVEEKTVELSFVNAFQAIHGMSGLAKYQKEKFYFNKLLQENPDLQDCTPLSLYGCFMEIASNGLSLDPGSKPLCYMIWRNAKSGRKDESNRDIYEKRAYILVTGYGELVQRQRANQIKYTDNPVVVFEGDLFEPGIDERGNKYVHYKMNLPHTGKRAIGAFIRITRADGSTDFQWILEDDIERLKTYSAKANSKWVKDNGQNKRVIGDPNALYSSHNKGIDPGFLENKMIKHAFDAFPKVRTSEFSILATQQDIEDKAPQETTVETTAEEVKDNEPFGGAPAAAPENVVTIQESNDETF